MRSILASVLCVTIFNFSSTRAGLQSPENWPTALIHHRKAALDYALKTEANSDCVCLKKFTTLKKDERRNACLNYLVNAISFSIPPDNRDYVHDAFESLVKKTFEEHSNIYHENLPYKSSDGEHRASAHMCIVSSGHKSWALSAGHHEGVSLVYKESGRLSEFELFGLLEEMPVIAPHLTQAQVDRIYETGEADVSDPESRSSENGENVRSLCDLNDYERFRLCAVGYLAREHSKTESPVYSEGNYIHLGPPRCIQSHIVLENVEPGNKSSFAADVISCAVNVESKDAEIFFTHDPHSADSMFSVEPQYRRARLCQLTNEGGISGTGFNLEFHMRNVRVLEPISVTC